MFYLVLTEPGVGLLSPFRQRHQIAPERISVADEP